jgi:hypothetical protein
MKSQLQLMLATLGLPAAILMTVAGVIALRGAWSQAGRGRILVVAGWTLLIVSFLGWLGLTAADKAIAFAMLAPSLAAFAIVAGGADFKRKTKRRPVQAVELTAGRPNTWRGVSRTVLAGPLSALTALAIVMLVATKAPFGDAARLIASGLLAPAVWAGFMAWSLYDSHLDRVFAALVLIALIGGAGIFL